MLKYWIISCTLIIALISLISLAKSLDTNELNPSRDVRWSADRADHQQLRKDSQYQTKNDPLSINSPICQLRGRCYADDLTSTAEDVRNCFCDVHCIAYDDCCRDYKPTLTLSPAVEITSVRDAAECRPLSNVTATQATTVDVHVWVINKCPSDYQDAIVRRHCEKINPSSPTSDSFYRLPVFGRDSRTLYANIYCALCSGEEKHVFWNAELRCSANTTDAPSRTKLPPSDTLSINSIEDLHVFINSGCTVRFLQNEGSTLLDEKATTINKSITTSGGNYPRRCTPNIDRCDRGWSNPKVEAKCRQRTEYVYAGNRAFRNIDCAHCNFVNETYLKCERTILVDDNVNIDNGAFVEQVDASVVVRLDFEVREAQIWEQSSNGVKESKIEFKICSDAGRSVYDPFSGKCRPLYCDRESGEEFHKLRCLKKVTMIRTGDGKRGNIAVTGGRSTKRSVTSAFNDDDDDDGYDDDDDDDLTTTIKFESTDPVKITKNIFSDPHPECERIYRDDYRIVDDNDGTIFVKSRNVVLDRERYYFDKSHSLFVCPLPIDLDEDLNGTLADLYEPMRLTIIHLNSPYQRLASISGLVLSILCLLASVFADVVYPELRNSVFGKSFLSLMLSLLAAHFLYLAIQIVERFNPEQLTCFCLSAAAQFASLAAVLWLNVMSIIVFNAILRTHSAAITAPTTLNERPTTSMIASSSTSFTSYLVYSLYAWVVPIAVVALSVAVAAFGIDGGYDTDERVDGCWSLGLTQLLLLIVPTALVFVANFAMYSIIFFRLCLRPIRVHTLSLGGGNSLARQTTFSHLEQQIKMTRQEQAMKEMKVHEKRYTVTFQLTVAMTLTWTFVIIATFTHWTVMSYLFVAFDTFLAVCVCFAALCNAKFCYLIGKRRQALRITDDSVRSHFETSTTTGKYCMLDMDGTTTYLKDDKDNIVLRETSI